MSKRLFAIGFLTLYSTNVLAASLSDTVGTPYQNAFAYLSQAGIVHGYPDGTGKPYNYLNRAEAVKVLTGIKSAHRKRVASFQAKMPELPLFHDIRQNQWFAPYVETAYEFGLVKGYPDGTFKPARNLTVAEAVTLLVRLTDGQMSPTNAQNSPVIQNRSNEWFTPYVNTVIARNLVMGGNPLQLDATISRGQFFDMVYRSLYIAQNRLAVFPGGVQVPTPNPIPNYNNQNNGEPIVDHPYASQQYFAITMPTLGINDLTVIHPEDPFSNDGVLGVLKDGVGHLFGYPGGGAKIMIYGHSSGYPWDLSEFTKIFRRVNELNPGDHIYVTYENRLYTYEVSFEQTIAAADTSPFNDNGSGEEIILYTCWPPDSIAERYLVHGKLIDSVRIR